MTDRTLRVVVGAPTRLLRQQLRRNLQKVVSDVRIVADATTTGGAVKLAHQFGPHLVLLATAHDEVHDRVVVAQIRDATTTKRTRVVLFPDEPYLEQVAPAQGILDVMPRSRYSNQAMAARLERVLAKL